MNYLIKIIQNPIFVFLSTFSAFVLAILLDWLQEKAELWQLLVGFGIVFLFIFLIVGLFGALSKMQHQEDFHNKLNDLHNIIVASKMTWLVSQKYVASLERESKETWVFTRKLQNDLDETSEIFKAVVRNLKKGNKYVYFLPKSPKTYKLVSDYKKLYDFEDNQVRFVLVAPREFLFYTEVVIFNADSNQARAIEWLPVQDLDFYIEMDLEHTDLVLGIGHSHMEEYGVDGKDE